MMKKTIYFSMFFMLAFCSTLFATPAQKLEVGEKAAQKISSALTQLGHGQHTPKVVQLCNGFFNNTLTQTTTAQTATIPYMHEMLQLHWETNKWIPEVKQLHLYDSNDLNTEVYSWEWDTSQWVKTSLMVMTYDAQNNPTIVLMKMWEASTGTWEDFAKIEMTYNALGDPTEFLVKIDFGGMWMDIMKMVFSYNAQDKLIEVLTQSFDILGMVWENSALELYSYNTAGEIDEIIEQDWDGSAWENANKITYAYNSNNYVSETLSMFWSGSWMNYQRTVYTYDSQWNVINVLEEVWDNTAYVNDFQYLMTYDAQNRVIVEIRQFWDMGAWENNEQVLWTYDQPVGISAASVLVADLQVYPNPATDRITLSAELIDPAYQVVMILFDATGRKAMEQSIGDLQSGTHSLSISLNGLRPGNYIMTVKCSQDVLFRQKLMVVR